MTTNFNYNFPFGQPLEKVVQRASSDKKKVFVLGVYASAVHAKWIGNNGRLLVKALAVASEPCIFWKGEEADTERIIKDIDTLGRGCLFPAETKFNGPSGRSLDENYLYPLGVLREDAWLCDLVPYSCQNPGQKNAIERVYKPMGLPLCTIPPVPSVLATEERVLEIVSELEKSGAGTIVLLGDQPIKWFLGRFISRYKKLKDFTDYGKPVPVFINDKEYNVIGLAHPRQTSQLGHAHKYWFDKHQNWMKDKDMIGLYGL